MAHYPCHWPFVHASPCLWDLYTPSGPRSSQFRNLPSALTKLSLPGPPPVPTPLTHFPNHMWLSTITLGYVGCLISSIRVRSPERGCLASTVFVIHIFLLKIVILLFVKLICAHSKKKKKSTKKILARPPRKAVGRTENWIRRLGVWISASPLLSIFSSEKWGK